MQSLRMRVKKEMTIVNAGDVEGVNEDIILHKGEEYEVNMRGCNGWPIVYVKGEDYDMAFDEENEFWEYWEFAPMSELDFREIFDVDNVGMEHIKEDIEQGFCSGYYDLACLRMLESELDARNILLNENVITPEAIIDYIMLQRDILGYYTLKDWVKDTKENYPEYFM